MVPPVDESAVVSSVPVVVGLSVVVSGSAVVPVEAACDSVDAVGSVGPVVSDTIQQSNTKISDQQEAECSI